jgi:hypothetical protein
MNYSFSAANQILLRAGKLVQATTADGRLLPQLRDVATGRIVEIAKATTEFSLESIAAPAQLVMGPIQMLQTHLGFQKTYKMLDTLQKSVAVLQGTTAVIGVGTVAGVALSGVNLYQTLKIRKNLQKIDLKIDRVLDCISSESEDIRQRIDRVTEDVEFRHHRTILERAYGQFQQALESLKNMLQIQESYDRAIHLAQISAILIQALADYKNPQIYSKNTNAPARIRRYECAWQMEQAIAMIFVWQGQFASASNQMQQLRKNIHQDTWDIISCCETEEELDFIYPELKRIYTHDLPVLEEWHFQIDYLKTAPKEELEAIKTVTDASETEILEVETSVENQLIEKIQYEQLKETSHFLALRDQLKCTINPEARKEYETYISERSPHHGYRSLAASNWKEVSDITVANLYWYLKLKDNEVSQMMA